MELKDRPATAKGLPAIRWGALASGGRTSYNTHHFMSTEDEKIMRTSRGGLLPHLSAVDRDGGPVARGTAAAAKGILAIRWGGPCPRHMDLLQGRATWTMDWTGGRTDYLG
mmetsp:Transcript_15799/g.23132  ORF Transcript_15799/g.23132 Transcript_15799/m.23132 type:complete len:111 (+) Transcript_15799:3504-3836(+)